MPETRHPEARGMVYVVDDDVLFRRSAERLLRASGFDVFGFASAEEFLAAKRVSVPSCVVLDLWMPGLTGLELQTRLVDANPSAEIVFITGHAEIPTSVRAMKAGAVEFLTKPVSDVELLDAVRQALERDRVARQSRAELGDMRRRYESLTKRERQVLRGVLHGLLNKQIAAELGITEITVKAHRKNMNAKMEAPSLAALVRMAERLDVSQDLEAAAAREREDDEPGES